MKEDYSLAKINDGNIVQLQCKTCNMPLMQRKGKGTVCVTCPRIRSKARKIAKKLRLEKRQALEKLDFIVKVPNFPKRADESDMNEIQNTMIKKISQIKEASVQKNEEVSTTQLEEQDEVISMELIGMSSISDDFDQEVKLDHKNTDKYCQNLKEMLSYSAKNRYELFEPGKIPIEQDYLPVPFNIDISFSNPSAFQADNKYSIHMTKEVKSDEISMEDKVHGHQDENMPPSEINLHFDKNYLNNGLKPNQKSESRMGETNSIFNSTAKSCSKDVIADESRHSTKCDRSGSLITNGTYQPKPEDITIGIPNKLDATFIDETNPDITANAITIESNMSDTDNIKPESATTSISIESEVISIDKSKAQNTATIPSRDDKATCPDESKPKSAIIVDESDISYIYELNDEAVSRGDENAGSNSSSCEHSLKINWNGCFKDENQENNKNKNQTEICQGKRMKDSIRIKIDSAVKTKINM